MPMETVRQKCRPKHQILVLKCYPQYQKGVQEVKPNSSELSYLLYYVSTRRSKLPKVSAFLEKRAARDVWRRKIGNVQVTLQILSALIEKVPRDLPIFARSVLTVIETVLRSRDISMVEDSIATFETFCRHQDMAALSAEQDFANQYRDVIQIYAGFSHEEHQPQSKVPSPPQAIRWKNAGLRAIKGVVTSEAGLAADGGDALRIMLPVIMENLYNGEDGLIASLERKLQEAERDVPDPAVRRRYSAVTVQTVDTAEGDPALAAQNIADVDKKAELDMRLLALRCLEQVIVNGSSRGQIRLTTRLVLDFILRKGQSNNTYLSLDTDENNWATSLMEVVAKWCPVQARFIISSAAMEVLFEIPPKEEDTLDRAFTVIYIIDYLLKSSVNMIGLSVIDVLLGLMRYMAMLVSPASVKGTDEQLAANEKPGYNDDTELPQKKKDLLLLLQKCIGDLTTHIYYGDQVVDMLRAILTRIKPPHGQDQVSPVVPEQLDGLFSEANPTSFFSTSAKVCALRAIKNILLVANSQRPMTSAGVDSRNPVGIHVWEGTHWLLQDPQKEVRYAYVDALLYWLKLETNKNDLKLKDRSTTTAILSVRRDFSDASERAASRATGVHQREKAVVVAQSNFLRLLHLTIYEVALQSPTQETEIRILYLLLASLVKNLGINAARFGLPMILKLQDDMTTLENSRTPAAKVNIGSLVHGYLWIVSETFGLDTHRSGQEIFTEIEKRKARSIWLDSIGFSLDSLESIIQDDRHALSHNTRETNKITPFKNGVEEFVRRVEESYNRTLSAHDPPTSPGRNLGKPVIGGHLSPANQQSGDLLPPVVREQMLSPWSKQSALEAAEREKAEALSLNGSRTGTLPVRGHAHANGTGSSISTNSPSTAHVATAGLQNSRRMSVPDKTATPNHSSSRDSPVRVNELRRVLSVQAPDRDRRLSPLRGRLDASNGSIISSSSESMVSGFSNSEFEGDGGSIRPPTRGGQGPLDDDGTETPRPLSNGSNYGYPQTSFRTSYSIPPVPPIPHGISIPGGFPNDSQRSLPTPDRPSTASSRKQSANNGMSDIAAPADSKTLHRQKSRTGAGLANGADVPEVAINGKSTGAHPCGLQKVEETSQRRDVQKLLEGVLSSSEPASTLQPRVASSYSGRRSVTGGIGRPPY
ncbi:protein efr3 [Aspergillus recurvatus]